MRQRRSRAIDKGCDPAGGIAFHPLVASLPTDPCRLAQRRERFLVLHVAGDKLYAFIHGRAVSFHGMRQHARDLSPMSPVCFVTYPASSEPRSHAVLELMACRHTRTSSRGAAIFAVTSSRSSTAGAADRAAVQPATAVGEIDPPCCHGRRHDNAKSASSKKTTTSNASLGGRTEPHLTYSEMTRATQRRTAVRPGPRSMRPDAGDTFNPRYQETDRPIFLGTLG